MAIGIFLVLVLSNPLNVKAPTIQTENLILVEGVSVRATIPPVSLNFAPMGVKTSKVDEYAVWLLGMEKYPDLVDFLMCLAQKESNFNKYAIGDNGKAKGLYQIWSKTHQITDECAFNIECATDFVAEKIDKGQGYLWTAYKYCQHLIK